MSLKSPPWGDHPSAITWRIEEPCKKCKFEYIKACQSIYSGTAHYFCPSCGNDYPDQSEEEEEEEEGSE